MQNLCISTLNLCIRHNMCENVKFLAVKNSNIMISVSVLVQRDATQSGQFIILHSWIKRDQLDVACFIISLFNAQHVSGVNTSILRSLRLICWVISWVVLLWYDACWCYVVVWLGWCSIRLQANAQHVSDVNTSILRSLRLSSGVISWVVLLWYDVCWWYVVVWLGWCGIRIQTESCIRIPHNPSQTTT
jgi:hypothetical protein